jgi:hypothetical protein
MKLDILEKHTREENPAFGLDTYEHVLDLVRHRVQETKNWMAKHDRNFSKRYIDGDLEIVIRLDFGGKSGVYDLVFLGRIHQTLRVTPAMEAGITDHVWDVPELLA